VTTTEEPTALRGFRVAVSARADYAVRALVALAMEPPSQPTKVTTIAARQEIPARFLANILPNLCRAGIVGSRRGGEGGYWLARPASEITLAEIVRAIEPAPVGRPARPSTSPVPVGGDALGGPAGSEETHAAAGTKSLLEVVRTSVQERLITVLESTTLLDVVRATPHPVLRADADRL
jgi:DNA-binding IscR family transcriptional regulator